MMKFVLLLCAIMAVVAFPNERPRSLCGRELAKARILLCSGLEGADSVIKNYDGDISSMQKTTPKRPWMVESTDDEGRPSLVDECCLRPCYMSEFLSHC